MTRKQRWLAGLLIPLAAVAIARPAAGLLVDTAAHWAAPLIAALETKGVISGDALGQFNPDQPLTRAQMAKMLVVALGNEPDAKLLAQYSSRFSDIAGWHWAKGYVEALAESGATNGYPDGTFGPADTVTRAQMTAFLVRAAGMENQARLLGHESTSFRDDGEIPEWARGAVNEAVSMGFISGYEDGTFRPNTPVTRAEGSVMIFRLLEFKGAAFHLTGTLVAYDPATRQGKVRDAMGQEYPFTMDRDAVYYRQGLPAGAQQVRRFDQVWISLGADGTGRFLEARYADLSGTSLSVNRQAVTLELPQGGRRTLSVQPGAMVFLNGKAVELSEADGAQDVYLVLDAATSEVRVLDAVKTTENDEFVGVTESRDQAMVNASGVPKSYALAADAVLLRNGERTSLDQIAPGSPVRLAFDAAGRISYLQVER